MIKFVQCKCDAENIDECLRLEEQILKLKEEFGDRKCSCHPNFEWVIAVDIDEKGFDIHYSYPTKKKEPCNYSNKIISEIKKTIICIQ